MTDRPYTDDDLRTEAAVLHRQFTAQAEVGIVGEQMEDHRIRSTGTAGDNGARTWTELLEPDGEETPQYAVAMRAVTNLICGAADVSGWAVDLGADGLEPADECLSLKGDGKPIVRIHFAFAPDMPDDVRQHLISGVAQAIDAEL